jgi:hypothetical protein
MIGQENSVFNEGSWAHRDLVEAETRSKSWRAISDHHGINKLYHKLEFIMKFPILSVNNKFT